jgi:hypothetical protein
MSISILASFYRHAEPTERLVNMFKAFQERMAKRIQRKIQDVSALKLTSRFWYFSKVLPQL